MKKKDENWELVLKVGDMWNSLSLEERQKYIIYNIETHLRVLIQTKSLFEKDMSPNLKRKITEWENNVAKHLREQLEKILKDEKNKLIENKEE